MQGLTAEGINKMMSGAGPMVKGIMISTAGKLSSIELDMTPKANAPAKVLGGDATILGQYAEIDAILMVLRKPNEMSEEEVGKAVAAPAPAASAGSASGASASAGSASAATSAFAANTYALPWPLHEETARGPILVVRMDEKSEPKDITTAEFTKFIEERAKTPIPADVAAHMEELKEAEQEQAEGIKMEADAQGEADEEDGDEDYDAEEEEEEEEGEEGEGGLDDFTKQLLIQCLKGFETKHGRKPNQEELAGIMATLGMLPEGLDGEEADEDEGEGELGEGEEEANDANEGKGKGKGGASASASAPAPAAAAAAAAGAAAPAPAAAAPAPAADATAPASASDDLLLQLIELYKEQNDGKEPTDEHLKQWTETLAEANAEAAAATVDAKENEHKENEKESTKVTGKRKAGDVDGPGPAALAPVAKAQKQ